MLNSQVTSGLPRRSAKSPRPTLGKATIAVSPLLRPQQAPLYREGMWLIQAVELLNNDPLLQVPFLVTEQGREVRR